MTKQLSRRSLTLHLSFLSRRQRTFSTSSWRNLNSSRKTSQVSLKRHHTKSSRRRENRTEKRTTGLKQRESRNSPRRDRLTKTTDRSRKSANQ